MRKKINMFRPARRFRAVVRPERDGMDTHPEIRKTIDTRHGDQPPSDHIGRGAMTRTKVFRRRPPRRSLSLSLSPPLPVVK